MAQRVEPQIERPVRLRSGPTAIPLALSGMLGAGLFLGLAPAASAAGWWLLLGLPIATLTAACLALVSAHQSVEYRGAGPAYACTRSRMGVTAARMSASAELVGRIAAMAAVAEVAGGYLLPGAPAGVAAGAVLLVVLASTTGLKVRGSASWLWVALPVGVVALVSAVCFAIAPATAPVHDHPHGDHAVGITGAAGILYFAFLGVERITAPREESDRFEWRSMRRGVLVSLLVTTLMCGLLAAALLHQLGPHRLALSPVPVFDALGAAAAGQLRELVGVVIAVAMLPVLLGALEAFRSTGMALVEDRELPAVLGKAGPSGTPYLLDVLTGVLAVVVVLVTDPAQAIAVAVCCLLVHQAFASAAGRILLADGPTWAMRLACLGMGLSVVLAMSMPVAALLVTAAVVVLGPLCAGVVSGRWS